MNLIRAILLLSFIQNICLPVFAREIRIGSTSLMAPYHYPESLEGLEIEIIKAALNIQGYNNLVKIDSSFKRAVNLLETHKVDLLTTNKENIQYSKISNISSSDITLHFMDCIIALKSSNVKFNNLSDLKGKRIWAFKPASLSLGKRYREAVETASEYNEYTDQLIQPKALSKGRMDFAVSDINIFYAQAIKDKINPNIYKAYKFKNSTPRVVRFTEVGLRNSFNIGLKKIKKNGIYDKILKKYKNLYRTKCNLEEL